MEATTPLTGSRPIPFELYPGEVFAKRYRILEKAGSGGMGVVYRALDETLNEPVALKLLRPELIHAPQFTERFKREVRLTRQLRHANVCRVFDIGEEEGKLFLSMAWVSGETLRNHLDRARGRLRRDQALWIAERIARALAAVHAEGVVHRDLKPGNVMIDDRGEVHVMDFGLAIDLHSEETSITLGPLGTPPYMSPEQRRGEITDSRTDLYALGLILREMLTGKRPDPEHGLLGDPRGGAGGGAGRLLDQLLCPDRDRRPADAERVADEIGRLRREGPWRERVKGVMQRHPQWSAMLAVLGTLALAVLIPLLAKGCEHVPTEAEIYTDRGVRYLREESETVQSTDDAILQFRHAIQADSLYAPAWAGLEEAYWTRYLKDKREESKIQALEAEKRAVELAPNLAETRLAVAAGLLAQGRYMEVEDALGGARKDRNVGDVAYAYAGRAHQALSDWLSAEADLKEALRRNPGSFRNWIYMGAYHQARGEFSEALKMFRQARTLKPDSPTAWANEGASLLYLGRFNEAIPPLERSLKIEENAVARSNLGTVYYSLGRIEDSIRQYEIAARLEPDSGTYWANLGDALAQAGRDSSATEAYAKAVVAGKKAVAANPNDMAARSLLGLWAARIGDRETALEQGEWAVREQGQTPAFVLNLAAIYVLCGEDEKGLTILGKAVELGTSRSDIALEPAFDRLRDDPRFQRTLRLAS